MLPWPSFEPSYHLGVTLAGEPSTFSDRVARKRIDSLDVARGVLCIAVMFIHVNPFPKSIQSAIYPAARLAVPLFFLFTGFLFFRRYDRLEDPAQRKAMANRSIKRFLLMYFGWFVILLVPTYMKRLWFNAGLVGGIINLVRATFFGSTFVASWYLMGSALGLFLLTRLERFVPEKAILALGVFLYLNCCLRSNYGNLAADGPLHAVLAFWEYLKVAPHISFPAAFFWLAVAHSLTRRIDRFAIWLERYGVLPVLIFAGMALLYFEDASIRILDLRVSNDCYLFLPPIAVFLFMAVLTTDVSCHAAASIRSWSSITYATHGTMRFVVERFLGAHEIVIANWMLFAAVFVICTIITWLVVTLSKREALGFLHWLY